MSDRKYKSASFRGVGFAVLSDGMEGGRRVVIHEYPQREKPYVEDLGKKVRSYPVEAFVIGDNYQYERDKLIEALETPGSGKLIHPKYGELNIQVLTFSVRETRDEGGMALFSFSFSETSDVQYPISNVDKLSTMKSSADFTDAIIAADFIKNFNTDVLDEVENALDKAIDEIQASLLPIHQALDTGARFKNLVGRFVAEAEILARTPGSFITRLQSLFEYPINPGLLAYDSNKNLFFNLQNYYDNIIYLNSQNSQIAENNNFLVMQAMLSKILNEESKAVISGYINIFQNNNSQNDIYKTIPRINAIKESIITDFEYLIENAGDENIYNSLMDSKIKFAQALPPEGVQLKDIVKKEIFFPIPAMVLSYDVYGDCSKDDEIIAMNSVIHPGAIEPKVLDLII